MVLVGVFVVRELDKIGLVNECCQCLDEGFCQYDGVTRVEMSDKLVPQMMHPAMQVTHPM